MVRGGRGDGLADGPDEAAKVSEQPVDVPSTEDRQRLLDACAGNAFEDRRDTAIIRLFLDAGRRLAELAGLQIDDLDLSAGVVGVKGKGDRYRTGSFGRKTATAPPSRGSDGGTSA